MIYSLLIPLAMGALGVLQNTVNKKVSMSFGVPLAIALNGVVLAACAFAFLFATRLAPEGSLPELFRQKESLRSVGLTAFLPGLFGFLIIVCLPSAIEKVGATRVFIGIIVAQIAVSILWDYFAESIPVSPLRIVGALLALAGALVAAR